MASTTDRATIFQKSAIALLTAGALTVSALGATKHFSGDAKTEPPRHAAVPADEAPIPSESPAAGLLASVPSSGPLAKPARVLTVSSTGKLSDLFRRVGYELDGVREKGEVPRVFLAALPKDLAKLPRPAQRKIMFIKSTLPLVLHANEQVLRQRSRIVGLQQRIAADAPLAGEDREWLEWIAERYGLDTVDFDALLERVDIIPPSLAIAQAAEESGWGTSRFAREGNALFGQRIYRNDRPGLVPKASDEGETFRVRAFSHLIDGVKAYAHNLNSHFAYDEFRAARAEMRAGEEVIDGYSLVEKLDRYSERGDAYLETIRLIMRVNHLDVFDRAWLREIAITEETAPDA